MSTSFEGRGCEVCGCNLKHQYFSLSKRSQTVSQSVEGMVITVLTDEMLADFCDNICWNEAEASIVSTLQVAYQALSMTARCSLCRRPVDRSAPHVTVNVAEYEDASQPWLISARILDEREIAVYCPTCAEPGQSYVEDEVADVDAMDVAAMCS